MEIIFNERGSKVSQPDLLFSSVHNSSPTGRGSLPLTRVVGTAHMPRPGRGRVPDLRQMSPVFNPAAVDRGRKGSTEGGRGKEQTAVCITGDASEAGAGAWNGGSLEPSVAP